jgi:dihydrodipicolinate synthase/N-acetylneuraminate lyase
VKAALAAMGRTQNMLRLPLVPLDAKHLPQLKAALAGAGVAT